jgi:hypothetical protein
LAILLNFWLTLKAIDRCGKKLLSSGLKVMSPSENSAEEIKFGV